jgi:hypothetical protein
MTKEQYMQFHRECCDKMIEITKKKNADYTGGADSPFSNFEQIGSLVQVSSVVEIGFLTRMSDKMSRIGSFITKGMLLCKDESVEDTLIDLANYCILFAGFLRTLRSRPQPGEDDDMLDSIRYAVAKDSGEAPMRYTLAQYEEMRAKRFLEDL